MALTALPEGQLLELLTQLQVRRQTSLSFTAKFAVDSRFSENDTGPNQSDFGSSARDSKCAVEVDDQDGFS